MSKKQKSDEPLPVYEVEFIPVERRLQDRRTKPASGNVPVERRQYGRRKEDAPQSPDDPAAPAAAGDRPGAKNK